MFEIEAQTSGQFWGVASLSDQEQGTTLTQRQPSANPRPSRTSENLHLKLTVEPDRSPKSELDQGVIVSEDQGDCLHCPYPFVVPRRLAKVRTFPDRRPDPVGGRFNNDSTSIGTILAIDGPATSGANLRCRLASHSHTSPPRDCQSLFQISFQRVGRPGAAASITTLSASSSNRIPSVSALSRILVDLVDSTSV